MSRACRNRAFENKGSTGPLTSNRVNSNSSAVLRIALKKSPRCCSAPFGTFDELTFITSISIVMPCQTTSFCHEEQTAASPFIQRSHWANSISCFSEIRLPSYYLQTSVEYSSCCTDGKENETVLERRILCLKRYVKKKGKPLPV